MARMRPDSTYANARSASAYARAKAAGEKAVLAAVPPATILRPSVMFGPEDEFTNRFAALALISPVLPLIGGGATKLQPVYVGDVATTVADAVELLRRERVGCLLVVKGEALVGIFTERDLLTKVLAPGQPLHTPLADVMTPSPVSVNLKEPVKAAVERMQRGGYRHVPVVDENNRPVGVLSAKRIVHYLVEHFPNTVYNQPPDPDQMPDSAEGA